MTPHYADESVTLYHGDCLDVMATMPDASVDAVVTDPPYGLGFMGRAWDDLPPGGEWARECLRVLKPGGHLLAFGGTRTWHRLATAVEDAGFEIRDSIAWLYGSGFPKSLDVSKAIDRDAGATREVVGVRAYADGKGRPEAWPGGPNGHEGWQRPGAPTGEREARSITAPATDAARQWQGWGTALKPAFEPIVVARKPVAGTVAGNVLAHGTGALNIDGTRVGSADNLARTSGGWQPDGYVGGTAQGYDNTANVATVTGRWPTNVVLDGDAADELDRQSGTSKSPTADRSYIRAQMDGEWSPKNITNGSIFEVGKPSTVVGYGDSGGASRFFPTFRYEAKAPTHERPRVDGESHATVKPLGLIRWLVRLVTPPGGTVLDPFAGSGTTGEACVIEGVRAVLIEREAAYLPLIVARLSKPIQPDLFGGAA